ncbi:MAG: glycoside hydrolase family 3 C-terminal domain-containing protein, partial [Clostridia bacterium]|nr:glycoside hydrolase family 3 C-terminal domain-containing protein [Clostridia bacterium]
AIDCALDIALDFIMGIAEQTKNDFIVHEDELSVKSTMESTVLLKNKKNLLPLEKNKKILIIDGFSPVENDQPFVDRLKGIFEDGGYEVSAEKIYLNENTTVKHRIDKVTSSCTRFDVTVLLLGYGYGAELKTHKTETLTLPPYQLYLANKVAQNSSSVLGVVFSEHSTDIDFSRPFDALVYAPLPIKHSAEALFNIISGKYNPSGRLAYTLYAGTETALEKGAAYIHNYGLKTGPFIGYRYYDTANLRVGYPFGHGLSYAQFRYSNISVSEGSVSFIVKNCSNVAGSEVAQIYIGLDASSIIRPKKELCGFAKIFLRPSEAKRVTIKIEAPKVFYNGEFVVEKGNYTVYVGASVSDIRLKADCFMGDADIDQDRERLSDYLQSHSNILNDSYTLEAKNSAMKKGFTNIIVGGIALALAIVLTVFNINTQLDAMVLGIVSGVLTLGAILLFIVDFVERSRAHVKEREQIMQENQVLFEGAEQIPVLSTDKMFEAQFDAAEEENTRFDPDAEANSDIDYSQYIDDQFRIGDAVAEFKRFAFERGYKFERGIVENLFASISVSKLLVVNGVSDTDFSALVQLISEYFGCSVCVDNTLDDGAENTSDKYDSEDKDVQKNIFKTLGNASATLEKMYFYAIDEIRGDNIYDWLTPLMRYIRSPKKRNYIVMPDNTGKNIDYTIGNNLWIMVRLSGDQSVDMLPVEVLKCASVLDLAFVKCQVADDQSLAHVYTSYQIEYMKSKVASKYEVPEDVWKRIDKLEKYAKGYSEYSIGNKLWLDLEAHMEMLIAASIELDEATDISLATRILPAMTASVKDKLTKDDMTVSQAIEFVFGVDSVMTHTKSYIKSLTLKQNNTVYVESDPADAVDTDAVEKDVVSSSEEEKTE